MDIFSTSLLTPPTSTTIAAALPSSGVPFHSGMQRDHPPVNGEL